MTHDWINASSLNEMAFELFVKSIHCPELDVRVVDVGDAKVLDFAVGREGTLEAGGRLAQICMGGLGKIELQQPTDDLDLPQVRVSTTAPLHACMGAQYAGWPISHEKYFAMGSGPMRSLRGKEAVLKQYDLVGAGTHAVGVLESNALPNLDVIKLVAAECNVQPRDVCLCVARTASYPGAVQVVARSVEVAMHKLHELEFDLAAIVDATGVAPLPPIASDDMTALGWTNDSMLYGAKVELTVETSDGEIEKILEQIPSCSSAEFGTPFLEIFNKYDKDFYKIDKMLFSPAEIVITNRTSGNVFRAGQIRNDVLKLSFGIE